MRRGEEDERVEEGGGRRTEERGRGRGGFVGLALRTGSIGRRGPETTRGPERTNDGPRTKATSEGNGWTIPRARAGTEKRPYEGRPG